MPFSKAFIQHATRSLWKPVIDRREDHEDDRPNNHIVEMGDDEIGVVQLPVERGGRQHDTGQAGDEELDEESEAEEHGSGKPKFSAPERTDPIEDLDPGRYADDHGRHDKES